MLSRIEGGTFQTSRKPIVDEDGDEVIVDDVVVYVEGEAVEPSFIDPDKGVVGLETPPAGNALVTADYSWHPVGDGEIALAIEAAEDEIESATGIRFYPHEKVERLKIHRGSEFSLSEPVISVQSLKVYDAGGRLVDGQAGYEVVSHETGLLRLKNYSAGTPTPPWYLTAPLEVEARYVAGFSETPPQVRKTALLIATYWILARVARQVGFSEDYGGVVAAAFTSDDIGERLSILRGEIERLKAGLPKRVLRA